MAARNNKDCGLWFSKHYWNNVDGVSAFSRNRCGSNSKRDSSRSKVDEEYMQFCFELIIREKNGEKIDYGKESVSFWNKKLKELIKH